MSAQTHNSFLDGPLSVIFAKTALPIILVMLMNGMLTVADALFLGHFVGQQALAAVTLVFPLYMLIVAFSTLVSGGMSSLVARHLGGGRIDEAETVFASAQWLAFAASLVIMALYLAFGGSGRALGGRQRSRSRRHGGHLYIDHRVFDAVDVRSLCQR